MTDYRMRNHDLLYADPSGRVLSGRNLAIFGSIALTVTVGVASYLMDRFNPATAGFKTVTPSVVAHQAPTPAPMPVVQLTQPGPSGS
jgi:hypothetical protein